LREAAPCRVVIEATGGLETALAAALVAAGVPVAVVNPRQVRDYAKAPGQMAKTDRIDALMLADFARVIRPTVRPLKDGFTRELDDLVTRRRQLVEMRVQETLRLGRASKVQEKSLKSHIAWLDKRIEGIDTDLRKRLRESPAWHAKDDLLRSIPGVGDTTSATLLAKLPELGTLDRKGIAALAGLAPLANDSGKQLGRRVIWGGRADVRCVLYMSTVAAIRCNPVLRAFAERLTDLPVVNTINALKVKRKL
jgi:transposase